MGGKDLFGSLMRQWMGWQSWFKALEERGWGVGGGGEAGTGGRMLKPCAGTEAKVVSTPTQQPGPNNQDSSLSFYCPEVICISTSQKSTVDP